MKKTVFLCGLVMMATLASGCAKKGIDDEARSAASAPVQIAEPAAQAQPQGASVAESDKAKRSAAAEALQTIYFAFDSFLLSEQARNTLKTNAQWLKSNPEVRITIEGHADERGSDEYNLALGDKRARMVKKYLVDLGIAPERLNTISYGEERPAVVGNDESAWSKNRRAEFL